MRTKSSIINLTLMYFLTHVVLIVLTRQWWDDWCLWTDDVDGMLEMYAEAGSPWSIINTVTAMALPH